MCSLCSTPPNSYYSTILDAAAGIRGLVPGEGATIEHMFAWMEELNEAQRAAVTHDGGPLRVLAGAGTGKTTALSASVAWLLATGTPAERILLLTFTRRAARQMLDRTGVLLAAQQRDGRSDPAATRVLGGTFHAVAHRTLRKYAQALGIPEGFSVLDPSDAADVIDLVREEGCYAQTCGQRFPRKALLLDLYSRAVNTGRSISTVTASGGAVGQRRRRSRSSRSAAATSPPSGPEACLTSTTFCCSGGQPPSMIGWVHGLLVRSITFWSMNTRM